MMVRRGVGQLLAHLRFGFVRELRIWGIERLRGQVLGCPAQELNLGGIAPAPNAVKQMNPHPQALRPGKPCIHRLRYQAGDFSAI